MTRKLKTARLSLLAVFAVSAVVASGASAANFTGAAYPVALEGAQVGTNVFSIGGGNVTCSTVNFRGELIEASSTQTLRPLYEGCSSFGFVNSTVTLNGCGYLIHVSSSTDGELALSCPSGQDVTVDAAGICTVHIPPQNNLATITFAQAGNHLDLTFEVTGITATITRDNIFLCPLSAGTVNNATYSGKVTLEGNGGGTKIDLA